VQTGAAGTHGSDFPVAVKALGADVPFAEFVAAGALFQTIEMRMGLAEFTGRKLGLTGPWVEIEMQYQYRTGENERSECPHPAE